MKKFLFLMLSLPLTSMATDEVGTIAAFEKLTCRKFDYYQLHGDRKVLEVAISKITNGNYKLEVADIYETVQDDLTFRETTRTPRHAPVEDMICTQSTTDNKVVTCRKNKTGGFDYISISKMDRTLVMSAQASVPAKIVRTSTMEIEILGDKISDTLRDMDVRNCIVTP